MPYERLLSLVFGEEWFYGGETFYLQFIIIIIIIIIGTISLPDGLFSGLISVILVHYSWTTYGSVVW